MNKIPILLDYDGVLGDTIRHLFLEYGRLKRLNPTLTKREYVQDLDWHSWLRKCGPRKDGFDVVKAHPACEAEICTACWSINEAREKILYIREKGIENNIIIVPGGVRKSSVVNLEGKIFVEDDEENIVDCVIHHGYPLYLGSKKTPFAPKIKSIEEAFEYAKQEDFAVRYALGSLNKA